MKITEALKVFRELDHRGVYVFSKTDLEKMFSDEKEKTLEKSLQRLTQDCVLERVCKGVYLNPMAKSKKSNVIEDIAMVIRRGSHSYVSLESILSEHGDISQIPMSRLTLMTTGAKGIYKTKYGVIEFTHTKRPLIDIVKKTVFDPSRRLRVATREAAKQDLMRVGRNVSMLQR